MRKIAVSSAPTPGPVSAGRDDGLVLCAEAFDRVESEVRLSRYGCDCYAYCMLAAGHVDLVVESGLKPYDIVALIPIIEGAGGVVTTWEGGPAANGGRIVAAGDPALHRIALEILNAG